MYLLRDLLLFDAIAHAGRLSERSKDSVVVYDDGKAYYVRTVHDAPPPNASITYRVEFRCIPEED